MDGGLYRLIKRAGKFEKGSIVSWFKTITEDSANLRSSGVNSIYTRYFMLETGKRDFGDELVLTNEEFELYLEKVEKITTVEYKKV